MKKLLKIVIGIVVLVVLAIVAVFYLTAGMADAADEFFAAIKKQDIAAARSYLSEDFKASTDEAALRAFLTNGALLNFKETTWSNRQVSGGRGELEGEVITESGGVVPLTLLFVKENDAWKIYGIQKPTAGLQSEQASPNVPSKADQVALVKQAMHDFAVSVNDKSMKHFHSTISQMWQRELTAEKFNELFAAFLESGLDLTVLDRFEPSMQPVSELDERGVLVLEGFFPTQPGQVKFKQQFVYEGIGWKLVAFSVNVGKG